MVGSICFVWDWPQLVETSIPSASQGNFSTSTWKIDRVWNCGLIERFCSSDCLTNNSNCPARHYIFGFRGETSSICTICRWNRPMVFQSDSIAICIVCKLLCFSFFGWGILLQEESIKTCFLWPHHYFSFNTSWTKFYSVSFSFDSVRYELGNFKDSCARHILLSNY